MAGAPRPVEGGVRAVRYAGSITAFGRGGTRTLLLANFGFTGSTGMHSIEKEPKRHLVVLTRIALLVAAGDWLTKAVAARFVGAEPLEFTHRLRFAVVHNDGTAFGLSAGAYTWQLNLALTLAAIVLMIPVARDLARIDRAAPRALGLIMGGAIGNLASLILSPPGVVDFISIAVGAHSEVVVNVADVAAYLGLAMMLRTGFLIVAEMRRRARRSRMVGVSLWVTATRPYVFDDREIDRPVPLGDRVIPESDLVVPRPESVRRAELVDQAMTDEPKVIDIRPHLMRHDVRDLPPEASRVASDRVD